MVLQARDVVKRYDGRAVLDGVSLNLAEGERLALVGPSGGGKSTLLNCLGGVDRFDAGSVKFAGQALEDLSAAGLARLRREQIGTVFQFFHLLPTLTAEENIELPLQLLGWPSAQRRERVEALLTRVGVAGRRQARPDKLSGGEMQRVAIARALAPRPRLLLADEPTGSLDSRTGEDILRLLQELTEQAGTALVMVTHSESAAAICSRKLHLRDGRVLEDTYGEAAVEAEA